MCLTSLGSARTCPLVVVAHAAIWHPYGQVPSSLPRPTCVCARVRARASPPPAQHTRAAMEHVGLSAVQQEAVLRVVAAVLHLGNVSFRDAPGQGDGGHEGAVVAGPAAERALALAAELLLGAGAGAGPEQAEALRAALTTRLITMPEGGAAPLALGVWG